MNTSTFISKEEFSKIRNHNPPKTFDENNCYIVQRRELEGWKTLCVSVTIDDTLRAVVNSSRYEYRVLKGTEDITKKLKSKSEGFIDQLDSVDLNRPSENTKKPMKPSEYKAMSSEAKQVMINKVKDLQLSGMKRNDIFHSLNISEATYDTIRSDISLNNVHNENAQTSYSSNNVSVKSNSGKIVRGSLLSRR